MGAPSRKENHESLLSPSCRMTALRKSETRKLIASLEAQGCRIEWAKAGGRRGADGLGVSGRFPVKVWPPDKNKHFILLHDTVSSPNDVIVKRTEVQRAGLVWPFDNKAATKALEKSLSRKEQDPPMSTSSVFDAVQAGKPLEHVKTPPAVLARSHPPQVTSIQAITPHLNGMPDTFWTDELVARLQAADVPGYRNKHAGMQTALSLLDWLGYRTVEAKPNRNGFSYRWVKDPNAVVQPGVTTSERVAKAAATRRGDATVTPIRANGAPVREVTTNVGQSLQEALLRREAAASIAIDKGDVQTISPEGEERKLHHDRKHCDTCNRWFTPEGYERHVSDTGHGVQKPSPQGDTETGAGPEAQGVTNAAGPAPSFTPDPDETLTPEWEADAGPALPTYEVVPKADYEVMERMAQEAEAKLAEAVHGKDEVIAQRDALNARLSELERELYDWHQRFTEADAERARLEQTSASQREMLRAAEAEREEAIRMLEEARPADDGSWLIEPDDTDLVVTLRQQAKLMGLVLEFRVHRA